MADKKVRCIGCGKPIAEEASIQVGFIKITCKCGTVNTIHADQKEKKDIPVGKEKAESDSWPRARTGEQY